MKRIEAAAAFAGHVVLVVAALGLVESAVAAKSRIGGIWACTRQGLVFTPHGKTPSKPIPMLWCGDVRESNHNLESRMVDENQFAAILPGGRSSLICTFRIRPTRAESDEAFRLAQASGKYTCASYDVKAGLEFCDEPGATLWTSHRFIPSRGIWDTRANAGFVIIEALDGRGNLNCDEGGNSCREELVAVSPVGHEIFRLGPHRVIEPLRLSSDGSWLAARILDEGDESGPDRDHVVRSSLIVCRK